MSKTLEHKISSGKANIAVVGLGYVGLPLAVAFAKKGFRVFGLDKDEDRVNRIKNKESYILDISPRDISLVVDRGNFSVTTSFESLKSADVVVICVPTPLKSKYTPDVSFLLESVRTIAKFLKKNTLVILESTTYPGTTRELIKPELEKSGLKAQKDFYLAFSPERIDPGNKIYPLARIPKIVGGLTVQSGQLTKLLYEKIIKEVHLVSSPEAAEMTKLLENSFRIINIGWINEVAMMCHKMAIDVWEVIEAAKTKPFGFMPFYPGLGVGGHCIPEDPLYLYWRAKHHGFSSKFIKLSADINSFMPQYAVNRLKDLLKGKKTLAQSRILVVGVTYKKDVKDLRKSPPLKLIRLLQKNKCRVDYFDPIIPYLEFETIHLKSISLLPKKISAFNCVVIATDHSGVDYSKILKHARLIFDVRNVYKNVSNEKIVKL